MKPKWAVEPYDPKAYLTAYNFDPVIKESLNCLNELHKTKTLCDHEEEIFAFDITDTQTGVNQAMDIQIWFDESKPEQIYCEIVVPLLRRIIGVEEMTINLYGQYIKIMFKNF